MENQENFYYTSEPSNDETKQETLFDLPILKQLLCFGIGCIGLRIFALLLSYIFVLFKDSLDAKIIDGVFQFAVYALLLAVLLGIIGFKFIKLIFKDFAKGETIIKGLIYFALMIGSSIFYNMLVRVIFGEIAQDNANEKAVNEIILNTPILSFLFVVIIGPLCEEITYRLGLCNFLTRKNKYLAVALSAIIFGLIHFNFDCFKDGTYKTELIALPSYILSGIILGVAYVREKSLAVSYTAHLSNNFLAFMATFMSTEAPNSPTSEGLRIISHALLR